MSLCCENCFADEYVRDFVRGMIAERKAKCPFCEKSKTSLVEVDDIAELILKGLQRGYESIDESGMPREFAHCDSVEDVINDCGLLSDVVNDEGKLTSAIVAACKPTVREINHGADDWTDASGYISRASWFSDEPNVTSFSGAWNYFKAITKLRHRFFDPPEQRDENGHPTDYLRLRSDVLAPVTLLFEKLRTTLSIGQSLWRAREAPKKPFGDPNKIRKYLGPPPNKNARHMRMNPVGIAHFYLSSDAKTCLAERRPDVGSDVWVGEFTNSHELTILDLTQKLEVEIRSIFDPAYDPELRWAPKFLRAFSRDISRPYSLNESELRYIPTQVLAEFIRHSGYHGIKFKSSQNPSGYNVVIFSGPNIEENTWSFPMSRKFHLWFTLAQCLQLRVSAVEFQTKAKADRKFNASDFDQSHPKRKWEF